MSVHGGVMIWGLVRSRLSPKEIRTADYLDILNHQVCSDFFFFPLPDGTGIVQGDDVRI